jgi:hypothetical protein
MDSKTADNSGFKKCGGQWLIEHLYFNQTFVLADSLSLRNPALLKPAKRCATFYQKGRIE